MNPVAVVMTVYNTPGAWVVEARNSVLSQLRPSDVLITWNDGSTNEDTLRVFPHGERFTRGGNQGIGIASNQAIALTQAPLIARLDADDRMTASTIDTLREYLTVNQQVDVVSGAMIYIRPDGTRIGEVSPPEMHGSPKHESIIVHSGCMFRRELWEHVGGYPDRGKGRGTDWYFWERCQAAGARFSVLPHFVIERRVHPDSHSFRKSKHLQQWWKKAQAA